MGRNPGPTFTRRRAVRGVIRVAAVFLALLATGCGGNSYVSYSANTLPAGGVSSGGSVYYQNGGSAAAAFLMIGFLGSVFWADDDQPQGWGIGRLVARRPAPSLDDSRTVNEQDCSKPIENWSANLKCR